MNKIKFQNGVFIATQDEKQLFLELLQKSLLSNNEEEHRLIADTILQPIERVAAYQEWLSGVLQPVQRDLSTTVKVAVDVPTAIGFSTSPTGQPFYTRPGRRYADIAMEAFDVGLQIGWFDPQVFGWNVVEKKIREAGEELARKRDAIRKAALDAAISAVPGHAATVAGSMTKASVDAIFASAASIGRNIVRVRINPKRLMDMTNWSWSSSNSLWQYNSPERNEEILRNGYVTNYGGALWEPFVGAPLNTVYFFTEPQYVGYEARVTGFPKSWTDSKLDTKSDYYVWMDFLGVYCVGNAVWSLTIL